MTSPLRHNDVITVEILQNLAGQNYKRLETFLSVKIYK